MARAGPPLSGWARCDEAAAAGPAAAPGLSGDADGSRGGGGAFYYFSALALRLAAGEGGQRDGRRGDGASPRQRAGRAGAAAAASRGRGARPRRCRGNGDPARRWEWRAWARCCVGGSPQWPGIPLAPGFSFGNQGVMRLQGPEVVQPGCSGLPWGAGETLSPSTTCGSTPHYCALQKDR